MKHRVREGAGREDESDARGTEVEIHLQMHRDGRFDHRERRGHRHDERRADRDRRQSQHGNDRNGLARFAMARSVIPDEHRSANERQERNDQERQAHAACFVQPAANRRPDHHRNARA